MKTIIVYHQVRQGVDCPDGICAAWVAARFFGEVTLVGVTHQPDYANYELPFPVKGNRIVLVDFCYPSSVLASLIQQATEVVIIDHHHTRMGDIGRFQKQILGGYSAKDCGSTFAWEYFFPGKPEPWFLLHVLRRDTGKDGYYDGETPESEAIATAMSHRREGLIGSQAFPIFEKLLNENPQTLVGEGKALLAERDHLVKESLEAYSEQTLKLVTTDESYQVPFLTIENAKAYKHISWVGTSLCQVYTAAPFVAIRTDSEPNKISLRSKSSSLVDCGEVAKTFGGGGHKNAAGFEKFIVFNPEGFFEVSD